MRLPDSGLPDLVVAPDLSNLPEGAVAIDLATGMEVDSEEDLEELLEQQEAAEHIEYMHDDKEPPPTERT